MSIIPADAVRQARTHEKAREIALELRKGGTYKAFINPDAPFKIWKENYDEKDQFIGETFYTINLTAQPVPTCSCPDFEKHGGYCKHTWAIEIAQDLEAQEEAQERQGELFTADYLLQAAMMDADAIDSDLRHNYGIAY